MAKQAGVTLTVQQRKLLAEHMRIEGNAQTAAGIGINVHTLRAAAGGLTIQRGTAAQIGQWLAANGGKS